MELSSRISKIGSRLDFTSKAAQNIISYLGVKENEMSLMNAGDPLPSIQEIPGMFHRRTFNPTSGTDKSETSNLRQSAPLPKSKHKPSLGEDVAGQPLRFT